MLTRLTGLILLQYVQASNHVAHLKLMYLYAYYASKNTFTKLFKYLLKLLALTVLDSPKLLVRY